MEYLKDLVSIVTRQRIRNIDLMTDYTKRSKINDLYEGVSNGSIKTDRQALEVLYPGQGKSASTAYRKLKERLIEQLVNAVLLIGSSADLNSTQRNYLSAVKYGAAAKLTRLRAGYGVSEILAKKNLKLAYKTEQTSIIVNMYGLLRGLMSRNGDLKNFEEYDRLFRQYNNLLQAEYQARGYLEHITLLSNRSAPIEKLIRLFREYESSLRSIALEKVSSTFILLSHMVYVSRCEIEGDEQDLQKNCEEAIKLLSQRDTVLNNHIFMFQFKSAEGYRFSQEFNEGELAIQRALQNLNNEESVNWFITKKEYVNLCFFCEKYKEGFDEYVNVVKRKKLKKLPRGDQEPWSIFRYYFAWYRSLGYLEVKSDEEKYLFFSMKGLIHQKPDQTKGRENYNAVILVLQLLFLIQLKKNGTLIDREESIAAYAQRHFRKKELYRTYYFVKLLLLLPVNKFNSVAIERKSEPLLKKMKNKIDENARQSQGIEVVPYEDLWGVIMTLI